MDVRRDPKSYSRSSEARGIACKRPGNCVDIIGANAWRNKLSAVHQDGTASENMFISGKMLVKLQSVDEVEFSIEYDQDVRGRRDVINLPFHSGF